MHETSCTLFGENHTCNVNFVQQARTLVNLSRLCRAAARSLGIRQVEGGHCTVFVVLYQVAASAIGWCACTQCFCSMTLSDVVLAEHALTKFWEAADHALEA